MIELLGVGVPRGRADEPAGRLSPADRVRFLVARALVRSPRYLVVRDLHGAVSPGEVGALLALLGLVARSGRLGVVVSVADGAAERSLADRLLVLRDGLLVFPGPPERLDAAPDAGSVGALVR